MSSRGGLIPLRKIPPPTTPNTAPWYGSRPPPARYRGARETAHALRNPLTVILGYMELLEAAKLGPVNEAQRGALQAMHESLDAALAVVDAMDGPAASEG